MAFCPLDSGKTFFCVAFFLSLAVTFLAAAPDSLPAQLLAHTFVLVFTLANKGRADLEDKFLIQAGGHGRLRPCQRSREGGALAVQASLQGLCGRYGWHNGGALNHPLPELLAMVDFIDEEFKTDIRKTRRRQFHMLRAGLQHFHHVWCDNYERRVLAAGKIRVLVDTVA